MSQLGTVYATKRRRRNGKSLKPPPKDGVTKSNPSKRHRERLNAELDLLASLLPFEQNILSKLDRLSILRLSVSYLRTKSYFQVVMHKDKEENGNSVLPHIHAHDGYRTRELGAFEHGLLDGDMFLQALNGFLMILTCDGEVFFATHSIESYLGFHQSDIVHQSVYELVHSEDREELQRQLLWNSFLPADMSSMQLAETLAPDKTIYLERSFTVRFRCLLDNTSGFLRLDIRGRIKILHGQNRKTEEPPLALFAYCTPFGPPSLLEIPHKENMFKSKHKLDFSLVSMDQRGKHILGYSDAELVNMGGYDLVHYDDLAYVASAHQELLKTGASGMIAYRYQKKDGEWQWLQTSSRLVYKNSKPDFVICTHRVLMDEEGYDLLGKRTMDFKVSYLDTGLASTYFSEADQLVVPPSGSPNSLPPPVTPTRPNRRYKTQLRDFLSTCRSKRKMQQQTQQSSPLGQVTSPAPVVEYLPDPAVAVAAAYSNLNPMYTTSPYATAADNIYMGTSVHSTNFYPVTENLFHQYRLQGVGGYYADYHHTGAPASAYVANGFLSYDGYAITSKEEKWQDTGKYYSGYSSGYGSPTSTPQQVPLKTPKSSPHVMEVVSCSSDGPSPVGSSVNSLNNPANNSSNGVVVTPKVELTPQDPYERQTVLMWGSQSSGIPINSLHNSAANRHTERSPQSTPLTNGGSLSYNQSETESSNKWNGSANNTTTKDAKSASTPDSYQMHHDDSGLYSASSHTTSPQHRLSSSGSSAGGGPGGGGGGGGGNNNHNTIMLNSQQSQHQQQQQQQQHQVLQLSAYNHHLQPLENISIQAGVGPVGNCQQNSSITSAASASSSPSCTSPIQTQQLPAISSVINGINGGSLHHSGSPGAGGVTVTTTPYHQLAIIASPIVITSATLESCAGEMTGQSVALQQLGGAAGRVATTLGNLTTTGGGGGGAGSGGSGSLGISGVLGTGIDSSTFKRNSSVMHPSTLAYATNAYVIGAPGTATTCATALGGLEQTIDGSPLLSFSEVTNTLLNQ
ncbi:aryl hydrocarbon receptor spineless [Cochliomyia hominivorax]